MIHNHYTLIIISLIALVYLRDAAKVLYKVEWEGKYIYEANTLSTVPLPEYFIVLGW